MPLSPAPPAPPAPPARKKILLPGKPSRTRRAYRVMKKLAPDRVKVKGQKGGGVGVKATWEF